MSELTVIIILGTIGWLWYDSVKAKEIALFGTRIRCESRGLRLLDQTVALTHIRLRRDHSGQMRIEREYQFEFSINGDDRHEGEVTLLANRIIKSRIEIPPHLHQQPLQE